MKTIILLSLICLLSISCAGFNPLPPPWTKGEKVLASWSIFAATLDTFSTLDFLNNGGYELNPIMGKYPSDEKVIAYMSLSQLGIMIISHFWPDHRSWLLGRKALLNTGWFFHNIRN